jgi:hypothetical protein
MSIALGSTFVDPGATCTDDVDSTCTVTASGTVDTNQIGTYFIRYGSVDIAGNSTAPVIRTVYVIDQIPPVVVLN